MNHTLMSRKESLNMVKISLLHSKKQKKIAGKDKIISVILSFLLILLSKTYAVGLYSIAFLFFSGCSLYNN